LQRNVPADNRIYLAEKKNLGVRGTLKSAIEVKLLYLLLLFVYLLLVNIVIGLLRYPDSSAGNSDHCAVENLE